MNINKLISRLVSITVIYLSIYGCSEKQHEQGVNTSEFKTGSSFPKVDLRDVGGKLVDLNAELKKGPILLNLWATWCQPCIEEMGDLVLLDSAKLGNPPLRVISINMDAPAARKDVEEFISKRGITFPVLMDPEWTTLELLKVQGYPETFLLSPKGTFLTINDPEGELNSIRILSKRKWAENKMKVALCEAIKTCNS